ncbi:MAG: hypothetical protein JNM56_20070 [Planctomycetia bacterium]|nr:hypothetical protein [Planctomycetia bacterium]
MDWSAVVAESFRDLQRQASRAGVGEPLLSAFKQIVERLHNDPMEAGEPLYRLPVLRMQVRCVVIRPLIVHYAVCEEQPLVIIKGGKLLSDT